MEERLILVVAIWLHDTTEVVAYLAYEPRAAAIMAEHGGRVERVMRMAVEPEKPYTPFEYHIVSFPDADAFATYTGDPRTIALADERAALIRHTELLKGHDVEIP